MADQEAPKKVAVADSVDIPLELAVGIQAEIRTAIALDHGIGYFVSVGMLDLFLVAYRDVLVISFAAVVVVAVAREAVAAARGVHQVRDWVVRHSQEAAFQIGPRIDQAVVAVALLHSLEEEVLVPSNVLDHWDKLDWDLSVFLDTQAEVYCLEWAVRLVHRVAEDHFPRSQRPPQQLIWPVPTYSNF